MAVCPLESQSAAAVPADLAIQPLIEARRQQIASGYRDRYWWRRKCRLERQLVRCAKRRSPYRPYAAQQAARLVRFSPAERDQLLYARKPHGLVWRKALPEAEFAAQVAADLASVNLELELAGQPPLEIDEECFGWRLELPDYAESGCDLGCFQIEFCHGGSVRVTGGAYEFRGHVHPHVGSDGHLCTGRFDNLHALLLRDGALEVVWQTVNQILRTYNASSPYCTLEDLIHGESDEECPACGNSFAPGDGLWIGDDLYCEYCVRDCDLCGATGRVDDEWSFCDDRCYCMSCAQEHLTRCAGCDELCTLESLLQGEDGDDYCFACAEACATCGKVWPTGELTMGEAGPSCAECRAAEPAEA